MHLVVGFFNIIVAHYVTSLYLVLHRDWIGRVAVRRSCSAYMAGAGLDDAAMSELRRMREGGVRLLQQEALRNGIAGHILMVLSGSQHLRD